jgi:very-long-chain enoyl-CoA reductase
VAGPQIGYRATFVIEYLGPMLLFPLFYYVGAPGLYVAGPHTRAQDVAFLLGMAHFAKRELESVLVHRFSHGTMPVSSCVRNCLHYWLLCGLLTGLLVFDPAYTGGVQDRTTMAALVVVWALAELGNAAVHLYQRSLRPAGSTVRKVPRGPLFALVSCPNYTFEVIAWVCFSIVIGHWSAWLFSIVGAGQMLQWADKKHREYKRDFADYPKGRKRMVPFVW